MLDEIFDTFLISEELDEIERLLEERGYTDPQLYEETQEELDEEFLLGGLN